MPAVHSKPMSPEQQLRMQKTQKMPYPIVLAEDAKERKFENMKYSMGAQTGYISMWRLHKAHPRDMIEHALAFHKAVDDRGLTQQQEAKLYRTCLSGTPLTAYDKAYTKYNASIAAIPAPAADARDALPFNLIDCLKTFIASRITESARYDQIEGMKYQKKPRSMDCHDWEDSYLLGFQAADLLYGDHPVPQGEALRRQYLESYAISWYQEFEKLKGKSLATFELSHITAFMHDRAIEANANALRNHQKQKAAKKQPRTAKHIKGKRKDPKDFRNFPAWKQCPIHPTASHKWGKCFDNPDNKDSPRNKKKAGSKADHANMQEDDGYAVDDAEVMEPGFQNPGSGARFDPSFRNIGDTNIAAAWRTLFEANPAEARLAFATRKKL